MNQIGIILILNFDWPAKMNQEIGQLAKDLHDAVQSADWIDEIVAASGGIGGQQSSIWIFRLANYAMLDNLLGNSEDEVSKAYQVFFKNMNNVEDQIREEVSFL